MSAPEPDPSHACRVCGYDMGEPPWDPTGGGPMWLICACCGAESGYEDTTPEAARMNRRRWLDSGAVWFEPKQRPVGWDPVEQLKNVPADFA